MTVMEPEEAARIIFRGLQRRREMLKGTAPQRMIEVSWLEPTTNRKDTPMSASLNKRIAALEAQDSGSEQKPFMTFKCPWMSPEEEAAFEAKLDARRRLHPRQQIIIVTWQPEQSTELSDHDR